MRRLLFLLATLVVLSNASSARALTFVVTASTSTGHGLDALDFYDVITVDIRMSNPSGVAIYGVGAGVQGWNEAFLELVSAEMNTGPYFCTTSACASGLSNSLPFATDPNTGNFIAGPADVQNVAGVGSYLPLVQAISTTGRAGNGARDPGLDGVVNGGDAQIRLVFRTLGVGTTTISIGTNPNPVLGNVVVLANGTTEQAINAFVSFSVVPEPGTALLLGLGLAALSARRRRS